MKTNAIRLYEYGTPDVLHWEKIDVPDPVDWFDIAQSIAWQSDESGSNLGHHVDGVVLPGMLNHCKADLSARLRDVHRFMIDFHRFDFLLEI